MNAQQSSDWCALQYAAYTQSNFSVFRCLIEEFHAQVTFEDKMGNNLLEKYLQRQSQLMTQYCPETVKCILRAGFPLHNLTEKDYKRIRNEVNVLEKERICMFHVSLRSMDHESKFAKLTKDCVNAIIKFL